MSNNNEVEPAPLVSYRVLAILVSVARITVDGVACVVALDGELRVRLLQHRQFVLLCAVATTENGTGSKCCNGQKTNRTEKLSDA